MASMQIYSSIDLFRSTLLNPEGSDHVNKAAEQWSDMATELQGLGGRYAAV